MNHIIIMLVLFFSLCVANAQNDTLSQQPKETKSWEDNHAMYFTFGPSLGNYFLGLDTDFTYMYKRKYAFRIGYSMNDNTDFASPDDLAGGLQAIFGPYPVQTFQNFQVSAGRVYNLTRNGVLRLNLLAGLGYAVFSTPGNWKPNRGGGFFGPNYTWDYSRQDALSVVFNPRIEFALAKFIGWNLSPTIQISRRKTFYGVSLGLMVGLLRKGKS